jgi:hypothetical protein
MPELSMNPQLEFQTLITLLEFCPGSDRTLLVAMEFWAFSSLQCLDSSA